ncbi:hypothetical protein KGO5_04672 [Sinorhizobium sp. KGO-5]|uniref:hypothetical protein n=1 Tax=Sinorhizobium sp. KGO-5 TaxID=1470810 RepID=UPI002948EB45|nr:hypothetical protein KGO5_04672 [Sinorhizobium sp. KGO-5]
MHADITFHVNPISPYDLNVIDAVFRAESRKRKLSRCTEEAEELPARLISLFQAVDGMLMNSRPLWQRPKRLAMAAQKG